MKIGKVIRKLRRDREMFQKELAEMVGVAQKTISYWEREKGDITVGSLVKVARAFNVPMSVFFEEESTCSR